MEFCLRLLNELDRRTKKPAGLRRVDGLIAEQSIAAYPHAGGIMAMEII